MAKYTPEQLNNSFNKKQLIDMYCDMQEKYEELSRNLEKLSEQFLIAQNQRFGRRTEKLSQIDGQLSLFNEAEVTSDPEAEEPDDEEVVTVIKKKKKKGQREEDLKDLPREPHSHSLTDEQLDEFYGKGQWRRMKPDTYVRVRFQPATVIVEDHTVDVAVGTGGDHQDEFLRGDRPTDLLRNSIATESMVSAILNAKYLNAMPLARIEKQFKMNGVNISRQTMANWVINVSKRYLNPLWLRLRQMLLENDLGIIQADETTCQIIHDNNPDDPNDVKGAPGHKNYMWVYRTCEFEKGCPIVLYDYQRTRNHTHPQEFLGNFHGILETDGLQQYHMLEGLIPDLVNANCWAHARRDFADAVKALGKGNKKRAKQTIAYQALARIGAIYKIENTLKEMSTEERLAERKKSIAPLVDEFFAWVKARLADTSVLPRGKTAEGLNYCINQEKYLRVFLTNGNVPIDNSASERAIRPFTLGRKNWVLINSIKGAQSSAVAYSIVETAKSNDLNVFYYLEYLLTEIKDMTPWFTDQKGNIDPTKLSVLDRLLPWSDQLPDKCHKPRR